jgi:hypothetical protein
VRDKRLANAAAAVVVAAAAVAGLWATSQDGSELVAASPLEGAVVEPTPYAVPTSPATDALPVITPSTVPRLSAGQASVPWQLIRLWDDQSDLAIQFNPGCDEAAEVHVEETAEHVLVQVVDQDGLDELDCLSFGRVLIALSEPLAGRPLLHAGTTPYSDVDESAASLAERFDDLPTWPGSPWFRDGRQVLRSELGVSAGPEHCGWEEAAYLSGSALPAPRDEHGALWARDPDGILEHFPRAQQEFRSPATLPADAEFTGYYQGPVEVWTAPSDEAEYVYLVNGRDRSDVERWVRGGGGCA